MMNNKAASVTIIVCIITLTALCFIEAIDITIVNNENETGVDNSSCLVGDIHCSALDFVFSNLSDCHNEPYNVLILGGNYDFNLNSTVTDNLFKNCPAINITGESTDSTSIVCGMDAGFAFQNILQVKIANITFTNCGSLRNSTSVNITVNSPNITLPLSAALYFTYCKNVQIINVIVENSNSTGVVMYNTYGVLLVEGTSFIGNSNQKNSLPSNGGLYIEFVYCEPGRVDENCVQQKNSHAHYCLKSNKFLFNYALNKFQGTLFHTPFKTKYYSFGRGGGLSIVFKGNASNNTVHIDDCEFFGNTASRGGGLLVEFEDFSNNNKMNISNTNFSENRVIVDVQNGYGTAGGGVRVGFVIYEQKSVQFNSMIFENCSFAGNTALSGGGLGMYIPYEPNVINATNSLSFKNCSWTRNKGLLGSAIDLDFWRFQTAGAKMQVTFSTCTFCDNKDSVQNNLDITTVWFDFNSFGAGALYANGIPVIFEESVEFINNTGSALAVYDTTVRFADGCHACFINNSAWVGGAVVMLGASQMWIYPHTKFLFEMNQAKLRGGAIYVLQTSRHDLLSGGNCFLQYSNHSVSSPCDWMTNFTFVNNTAPTGTSIFATTLLSCAWGESLKNLNHSLLNVLNWTNFSYYPSDNNTIATEVSKISVETNRSIEIIPGKYSTLPITTVDDKGNDVSRSLWLVSNNKSVQVSWHITSNSSINLQGTPNSEATIEIVTDISRVISAKLPVKLAECPPGYYLDANNVNGTCQCSYLNSEQRLDGILSCDSETFTAKIKRGYWAGYHLSAEHPTPTDINLVTGQCPRHYCVVKDPDGYLPGTNNITLLNEMFCSIAHRNGTLCGRCSNGYGVAINSVYFDCVDCSDWLSQHGWIIYALTEYVPLTLLFCIILFFDINLHSGTISSVVLYFQIFDFLDIYSDGDINPLPHSDGIVRGIYFVYNIWNLEFFGFLLPSYCLNKHFNAMDIFVIKYVSGFYPFVLFVLFLALTNLVYVNCCGVAKVARYIRNECTWCRIRINRKGSTVNGLATLWTLVFTKLAVISGLILSQGTLTGSEHSNLKLKVAWLNGNLPYGGEAHLPYMIPAVVILLFFVIIPAVGLFCYPLVPQILGFIERKCAVDFKKCKLYNIVSCALQKPFTDLKPLIDCFQGDCRERCEFYAGLLFLYRIATVIVFSFRIKIDIYFYNTLTSLLLILITAILQPYEKWRDNVVTALCFANILFISVLSLCLLYYTETQSNRNLQPWLLLQLVMVLLPLVFFIVFMMWRSWQKLEACLNKGYSYNRVSQNETDELNFPVRALEDSVQSQANESNDNGRRASPHSPSASGSVQNREGTSEGNNSKSSINPNANYGSCGYQHNTSDN